MRARRLVVFTTHPIQYQAPWFRAIAADGRFVLNVVFSYVPSSAAQGIGFGKDFTWDVPLREGYDSEVLGRRGFAPEGSRFASGLALGVRDVLTRFKPDAALILGWQDLSLVQALAACKLMGVPVIMRGESNDKRPRAWWKTAIHKHYVTRADAYLAIGDANASFYRLCGIDDAKIRMARYCVDNRRFMDAAEALRHERAALRAAWQIEEGDFCAAFVGKLEQKKRVSDVLQAVALARRDGARLRALVVGTGEQMDQARALANTLDIPVTFAGFLNQTRMAAAYVAADALVLPSDFGETWGLVCNEAMACGTPAIVSTRAGCADDLVVDGETGQVVPFGEPAGIADALGRWAADRELHQRMSRSAVDHVTTRYSIELAVKGLHEAMDIAVHGEQEATPPAKATPP